MQRIEIIGGGVVGQGMKKLFERHFTVAIHDPPKGIFTIPHVFDLSIICVPSPMKEDGSCDINAVEESVEYSTAPLILIKSTIPPGTTEYLAKKYNKNICFSPEYMGESKYFTPYWKYPDPTRAETHTFVIIGGEKASEVANFFMKVMSVDTVYSLCTSMEAELAKYAENTFFATKVTFVNEFYNICNAFGADWKKVRENWLLDSRINKNHTLVFEDNRGYSGKCYPKDIAAIIKASEEKGYEPTLLKAVVETNNKIREN